MKNPLLDDEQLKEVVRMLEEEHLKFKCLRHRFKPTTRRCRLCDAKAEAKGKFEYARKIYLSSDD